jgi:hypothetical protein
MTKQACAAMEADLQPIVIQLGDDELASCVVLFFRITQYIGCD